MCPLQNEYLSCFRDHQYFEWPGCLHCKDSMPYTFETQFQTLLSSVQRHNPFLPTLHHRNDTDILLNTAVRKRYTLAELHPYHFAKLETPNYVWNKWWFLTLTPLDLFFSLHFSFVCWAVLIVFELSFRIYLKRSLFHEDSVHNNYNYCHPDCYVNELTCIFNGSVIIFQWSFSSRWCCIALVSGFSYGPV